MEIERRFPGLCAGQPAARDPVGLQDPAARAGPAGHDSLGPVAGRTHRDRGAEDREAAAGRAPEGPRGRGQARAGQRASGWWRSRASSLERGDPKEAERWATRALAIQPDNAEALALRARARAARGRVRRRPEGPRRPVAGRAREPAGALCRQLRVSRRGPELRRRRGDVRAHPRRPVRPRRRRAREGEAHRRAAARANETAAAAQKSAPRPARSDRPVGPFGRGRRDGFHGEQASGPPPDLAAQSRAALEESRRLVAAGQIRRGRKAAQRRGESGSGQSRLAAGVARGRVPGPLLPERGRPGRRSSSPSRKPRRPRCSMQPSSSTRRARRDEARGYLQQAMPRVSGALVDEYSKKILGTGAAR